LQGHGYAVYEMEEDLVREYLSGLTRHRGGSLPKAVQGLGHLVRFLQQHGVTHLRQDGRVISPLDQWLSAYDAHLEHVAGLAPSTRQGYRHLVRCFLTDCFGTEPLDWSALTATQITAFVSREAARRRNTGRKQPAVALRSFLRFLVFSGDIRPGLEAAAPAPPQWKYASLPSRLTLEEVERVLAVYHHGSAISVRNRAILCLARLGLRAQDVVSLCFDDLDWADGRLALRPGKTHRARHVPLHPSTAERLRHYQAQRAHWRSDTPSAAFFMSERGQHLQHRALHDWFARLCRRLAIVPTDGGRAPCLTSFRHTFAVTRMQCWHQQGFDVQALLPHLSVSLGHVHPQESYWYLTAAPELLSAAAHRFETFVHGGGTRHA
jgi:site-specific recombinase XerC